MRRAIPTISLLLAALAGYALVRSCSGDIVVPVEGPPPIAIEPAPPPTGSPGPATPTPASDAPGADVTEVWLDLRTDARFEPSRTPAIEVWRLGKPVEAQVEIVAGDPDADAAGAERPRPRLLRVQIAGAVWHRQAIAQRDVLHVELGPDRVLRGRVVDRGTTPVVGARVFTGGAVDEEVTTDEDGRFEVRVPAGPGVPVVVRAPNKAWRHAIVDVSADSGAEVAFVLADEMPLEVQALGPRAALVEAAAAALPSDAPDTDLQAYPLFAQDLFGPAPIDENGRAIVRGLPRGAVVAALVFGPRLQCTRSADVALRRAPARADVTVSERPTITGNIVDESGAPVVGADVWWCEPGEGRPWVAARAPGLVPSWWPAAGVVLGQSDEGGAFELAQPPDQDAGSTWLCASLPSGPTVRLVTPAGKAGLRLVLPAKVPARATLVVARPEPAAAWSLRLSVDEVVVRLPQPAGTDAEVPLDKPGGVYALRVRIGHEDAWSAPRELPAFVIAGRTVVPAALLQR